MSGRVGFTGFMDGTEFKNRFYKFGHSGYFEPFEDENPDEKTHVHFMRSQWMPVLLSDRGIELRDDRKSRWWTPLLYLLLAWADPIKLVFYGALVFVPVWFGLIVPQHRAAIARAEADAIAQTAFQSMQTFAEDVSHDEKLQNLPELAPTRKKLMETASKLFETLTDRLKDEADLGEDARRELAKAHIEIARLTTEIGGPSRESITHAIEHFEKASKSLKDLEEQRPGNPSTLWAMSKALTGLGDGYLSLLKMDGSGPASRAQQPLSQARDILTHLGLENVPNEEDYLKTMAWTLIDLGVLDPDRASDYYQQARKYLGGSKPAGALRDDYGWLLINHGMLQARAGNREAAKKSLVEARDIFDEIDKSAGQRVPSFRENLAWSLHDLARVELDLGQREALIDLKRARDLFSDLAQHFPDRGPRYQLGLASTCKDLGEAMRVLDSPSDEVDRGKARDYLREALSIYNALPKQKQDEESIRIPRAWAEHHLGWILVDLALGRERAHDGSAQALLKEAVEHLRQAHDTEPGVPEFALGYSCGLISIARRQQAHRFTVEATKSCNQAKAILEELQARLPREDPNFARVGDALVACSAVFQAVDSEIKLPRGVLKARASGIAEAPVPVLLNGKPLHLDGSGQPARFKIVEIFENASTTHHLPLILADLMAIGYVRATYQKPDGFGASLGTSVLGTPSFRPRQAPLSLVPQVADAEIITGGSDQVRIGIQGHHGTKADVSLARAYPASAIGRSSMNLSVKLVAREPIELDKDLRGTDAFRLLTVSSMFATENQYDANVLRYQDRAKVVHTIKLDRATPRNAHLLPRGIELGTWFELSKTPGSRWFPESPSIRVDILRRSGVPGRLGIQGYLLDSANPNDDSLSVWVEWLDAPEVIGPGTNLQLDAMVTATPPG
jgi:tetratricopeptide (TPR) repeat protein